MGGSFCHAKPSLETNKIVGEEINLDKSSQVIGGPCAILYTSINYGGQSMVIQTTGSYYKNLGPTFANNAKSAKVYPGCMLKLYKDFSAVGLLQSVPSDIPSF